MINMVIADDHQLIRDGIKNVVSATSDIRVIGEAKDGNELLAILEKLSPQILILDITMPMKSGLDLLKQVVELHPGLPVLMLSIHSAERFAIRALKAGAWGYLTKTSISDELILAIRKIVTGKRKYITEEVADILASEMDVNKGSPRHQELSDREFQVLCMIAGGKKVSEIAKEFSLSPQTVHSYRSRIKEKMNLESNVQMTRYAIDNNLLD